MEKSLNILVHLASSWSISAAFGFVSWCNHNSTKAIFQGADGARIAFGVAHRYAGGHLFPLSRKADAPPTLAESRPVRPRRYPVADRARDPGSRKTVVCLARRACAAGRRALHDRQPAP